MNRILTAGGPGPFDPKKDKPTLPVKTSDTKKRKK
ncbi:MAG: hypothetical protein RJA36_906 [Pseudomonadota bacterium]|jgi:hypothetical protein